MGRGWGRRVPSAAVLPRTGRVTSEALVRRHLRSAVWSAGLFGLVSLTITCTADSPSTGTMEQGVINPPLPNNLNLILNSKTTVTIGAFSNIIGDVASSGLSGSVLFDVGATQGFGFSGFRVLANTVTINTSAAVGTVIGNDITNNGFVSQEQLGLDPDALPQIPLVTKGTAGATNVSTSANQAKQLCPGQYGTISLGINSVLNLNGGVYQVSKLVLADGARLEPSEPVVILVSGNVITGIGSAIQSSTQSLNPMRSSDIRIDVGGAVTLSDNNRVTAHLLVTGKLTAGKQLNMTGAVWAKTISIGPQSSVLGEDTFATQAPAVPPPCNDNKACTVDSCVGGGTAVAFCSNAPLAAGTACGDDNACNGLEVCDGIGTCQPGTIQAAGTACPDGDLCNGDEACNGAGTCLSGAPPVVNDNNTCTADACDSGTGVAHIPLPDGTVCNGSGVCTAGTCSVNCAHDKCVTGGRLTADCDPCVASICSVDSFCCNTAWDSICVGEVASVCHLSCPLGLTGPGDISPLRP
jgi:hypothetical protein